MTVWCLTPLSIVFQLSRSGQCTYPCFPGALFTSTTHNILFKPLAAFPHNRNYGQRQERNESCRNDYHQSSERILANPGIEPATSCSQVYNATDRAMGLGANLCETFISTLCLPYPIPKQAQDFMCLQSKSFENTVGKKKELLLTSNFFFSHSVFYPFVEISAFFIKFEIVVCKLFQFGLVQNMSFGKGLIICVCKYRAYIAL